MDPRSAVLKAALVVMEIDDKVVAKFKADDEMRDLASYHAVLRKKAIMDMLNMYDLYSTTSLADLIDQITANEVEDLVW